MFPEWIVFIILDCLLRTILGHNEGADLWVKSGANRYPVKNEVSASWPPPPVACRPLHVLFLPLHPDFRWPIPLGVVTLETAPHVFIKRQRVDMEMGSNKARVCRNRRHVCDLRVLSVEGSDPHQSQMVNLGWPGPGLMSVILLCFSDLVEVNMVNLNLGNL